MCLPQTPGAASGALAGHQRAARRPGQGARGTRVAGGKWAVTDARCPRRVYPAGGALGAHACAPCACRRGWQQSNSGRGRLACRHGGCWRGHVAIRDAQRGVGLRGVPRVLRSQHGAGARAEWVQCGGAGAVRRPAVPALSFRVKVPRAEGPAEYGGASRSSAACTAIARGCHGPL
jgi:hypothetical protein